jgi:hypothetical protein
MCPTNTELSNKGGPKNEGGDKHKILLSGKSVSLMHSYKSGFFLQGKTSKQHENIAYR